MYFEYPPGAGIRNSASKLKPGLDVRGDGGYVLIPPSIHPTGAAYAWAEPGEDAPIVQPSLWLLEALGIPAQRIAVPTADGDAILEGGRNDTLTSLAGTMHRRGMVQESIEVALLKENAARCKPPLPEAEVLRIAASVGRYVHGDTNSVEPQVIPVAKDRPEPVPLGDELPAVQSLDPQLLPIALRTLVEDISERMQAPPDYAAVAAIVSLAGCVGRRALIQPKVQDTEWRVVPNLWGAIIAPPGFMKSPILRAITLPLTQIEEMWRAEYERAKERFEIEKEKAEISHQAWKEDYKRAVKKNLLPPIQQDKSLSVPKQRRLVLTSATYEKLHEILGENPGGVLVVRDELTGWLAELDRVGREGERAFMLQSWNGDSGFTVDRIGRGSIYVPAACVSLVGNIQPARLRWYLAQALEGGPCDDGLFPRFQVVVWPDPPREWRLVDRPPNQDALRSAQRMFGSLANLSADSPSLIVFAPDAQELFFAWWADLENRLRDSVGIPPVLMAHLGKYRKMMPSLAGLFELADRAAKGSSLDEVKITPEHTRQAAAFCEFLESHARRVYSCAITPELRAAHELARHLRAGGLPSPFSTRSVYLKGWSGLDKPDRVRAALGLLEEAGWIVQMLNESSAKGGRPSEQWLVNPKVAAK